MKADGNNPNVHQHWKDKENVVYSYIGFSSHIKKEVSSSTCYNLDELGKHYTKWHKPDIKGQILYDSTYTEYLE